MFAEREGEKTFRTYRMPTCCRHPVKYVRNGQCGPGMGGVFRNPPYRFLMAFGLFPFRLGSQLCGSEVSSLLRLGLRC